jgi:DNA-binding transcriptional ArsR family regulator
MGTTMPEPLTPDSLAATVRLLSATAHPLRLSVLLTLSREGVLSAGTLAERLGAEQSALSHQLRILRNADLVTGTRHGKRVIYELADHHVAHIVEDALAHAAEHGVRPTT